MKLGQKGSSRIVTTVACLFMCLLDIMRPTAHVSDHLALSLVVVDSCLLDDSLQE